jgi:hypothetical protein
MGMDYKFSRSEEGIGGTAELVNVTYYNFMPAVQYVCHYAVIILLPLQLASLPSTLSSLFMNVYVCGLR